MKRRTFIALVMLGLVGCVTTPVYAKWILQSGAWGDNGYWMDNQNWKD